MTKAISTTTVSPRARDRRDDDCVHLLVNEVKMATKNDGHPDNSSKNDDANRNNDDSYSRKYLKNRKSETEFRASKVIY